MKIPAALAGLSTQGNLLRPKEGELLKKENFKLLSTLMFKICLFDCEHDGNGNGDIKRGQIWFSWIGLSSLSEGGRTFKSNPLER